MSTNPPSKRWVDYSDSDSPDESNHSTPPNSPPPPKPQSLPAPQQVKKKTYRPTRQQTNKQMDIIDRLYKRKIDEVWVDIFSQNIDYLEQQIEYLRSKVKKGGNVVQVSSTEDPQLYQVKVYIRIAEDYIQDGYDPHDYVRVTVSDRNKDERRREGKGKYEEKKQDDKRRKYVNKDEQKKERQNQKREYADKVQEKKQENIQKRTKYAQKQEPPQSSKTESPTKSKGKEKPKEKKKKGVTSKYASNNPFECMEDL